jgi:2-keto-4-pentenoate hydratase
MPLSAAAIAEAGRLLAAARSDGVSLQILPAACRPATQKEAEAIQRATFATLGHTIGGWKLGRAGGLPFAAPLPLATIVQGPATLPPMPGGARVELELALRLRRPVPLAELSALDLENLPGVADLVPLVEIVRSRWAPDAAVGPIDRIADCISNQFAAIGAPLGPWQLSMVETPAARLCFDGREFAVQQGPHPAAPIEELLQAWRMRCQALGHAPRAGEVVTLGTLTGILPLPPPGTVIRGVVLGQGEILCRTASIDGA